MSEESPLEAFDEDSYLMSIERMKSKTDNE
jgi:hypothetical protein